MNNSTVLRPQQIKKYLNASISTVSNLLATGKLPKIKLPDNSIGVLKTDLDAYILGQRDAYTESIIFVDIHGNCFDLDSLDESDTYFPVGVSKNYIDRLVNIRLEQQA
jgi:hypothetical protein